MSDDKENDCANPHILKFLNQKIKYIKESGGDMKKIGIYKKAINSVIVYPLPIFSGKECEFLTGIGPSLSKQIDTFLKTNKHPQFPIGPPTPLRSIRERYQDNPQSSLINKRINPKKSTVSKKTKTSAQTNSPKHINLNTDELISPHNNKKRYHFEFNESFLFDNETDIENDVNNVNINNNLSSPIRNQSINYDEISLSPSNFNNQDNNIIIPISPVPNSPYSSYHCNISSIDLSRVRSPLFTSHPKTTVSSPSPRKILPEPSLFSPFSHSPFLNKNKNPNNNNRLLSPFKSPSKSTRNYQNSINTINSPFKKKKTSHLSNPIFISNNNNNSNLNIPKFKEIVCLIDNREVKSVKERDYINNKLLEKGVKSRIIKLELGDFLWVAKTYDNKEYLLNYVIERKKTDDLSCSIIDGRYKEQKFRLNKSGIDNIIYLIEGSLSNTFTAGSNSYNTQFGLPQETLQKAIVSTQVINGIICKETLNLDETIKYLVSITLFLTNKIITNRIANENNIKNLLFKWNSNEGIGGTIEDFNISNVKTKGMKLKEFFASQLLNISGCTPEKAYTIVSIYPTPFKLWKEYELISKKKGEELLSDLRYGTKNLKIGNELSSQIYHFFHDLNY